MTRAFFAALACASLSCMSVSLAQPYPTRSVTLIVPYGAGGPLDTLTRIVSERMRVSLGQPIVIDNITGASGVIGVGRAIRADPDGYTVSVGNWPTHVVNGATFTLQYDLLRDLEPVALLSSNPYVVVARNGLPAKNLRELIDVLKANPEKLTLGTAGPGSGRVGRKIGLADDRHRVRGLSQTGGIHIPHQYPIVGAVGNEQALVLLVENRSID